MSRPSATYSLAELVTPGASVHPEQFPAIQAALTQAALALSPGLDRVSSHQASTLLCQAIGLLRRRPETRAAALSLCRNVHPAFFDKTSISVMRCRLLLDLGPAEQAEAEADRLLSLCPAVPERDQRIRQMMAEHPVSRRLQPDRSTHDTVWGPPQPSFVEAARHLQLDHISRKIHPTVINHLLRIRAPANTDAAAATADLAWGIAVRDYARYLGSLSAKGLDPADPLTRLGADMFARDDTAALVTLRRLTDQHRGIVVLQSHSGRRGLISATLNRLGVPLSLVGKGDRAGNIARGDFNISTLSPTMTLDFLKLVKMHRKGPRITRIFPDGPDGTEHQQVDLFGRKVSIAMGASTLAWFGKAVLVFAKTHWTGQGWRVEVEIGPDFAEYSDKDAADAAFVAFYADNLRKLLLGPLRDLGGHGGFVQAIMRAKR